MKKVLEFLVQLVFEPAFILGLALIIFAVCQRSCTCSVSIDSKPTDAASDSL